MFAKKIHLTQDYIDLIVKKRKEHSLTAYELSEKLGKNKSWIPNIENHRTKNITKDNLLLIFNDFAKKQNMDTENYIIKYLHPNAIVELDDNTQVPCFLLQSRLNLTPPASEEFSPEYMEDIHTQRYISNFKAYLEKIADGIIDQYIHLSGEEQQFVLDALDKMEYNLQTDFLTTFHFLNVDLFGSSYNEDSSNLFNRQIFKEVNNKINDTCNWFKLHNAKSDVYEYFSTTNVSDFYVPEKDFYDSQPSFTEEVDELSSELSNIESYLYAVYKYVDYAFEFSMENTVDFYKIYHVARQYLYSFIGRAKISYKIDITLSKNDSVTRESINALHLHFISIYHDIKRAFQKKYAPYLNK